MSNPDLDSIAPTTTDTGLPIAPQPDALLQRIDELLQLAMQSDGVAEAERACEHLARQVAEQKLIGDMAASLAQLRRAVADRDRKLAELSQRSEALARAQAEAIVHSAEIIDELERTKQHLSDARSASEQAAKDTQRLADTVFERTNDGVLVIQNQSCVACNDNAVKLLGSDRTELIGSWPGALDLAVYDNGATAADDLRCACRQSASDNRSFEVMLPVSQAADFWVEISMSAFSMKDAGHVLVVVRDATARKRFEKELRRHSDFLNNIINAVPDQLSVRASDHKLVVANDAFCRARGLGRDEIIGEDPNGFLPDEVADQIRDMERQLVSAEPAETQRSTATRRCETSEHEFRQPDGTRAVLSVKRSMFEDNRGDRYVVATSRDITDDRDREDRLRLLASVFDSASEGVAILSPVGQIREANPAFIAMSATAGQPAIGKLLTDALQFEIRDFGNVLAGVAAGDSWAGKASSTRPLEALHQGSSRPVQVQDMAATGRRQGERFYWVSLSPSRETSEQSPRIIALVSDITELENTQAKLRRQTLYDNLTGLPNRRFFRDHLQRLVDESKSGESEGISICFLDLDDFKHVNDSAGHRVGDCLLQAVGSRIQRVVGGDAFVARFGGDEFAVLVTDCDQSPAKLIGTLDKLLASFREPFRLQGTEASVGLSIGVTSFPDHAGDVDTLMSNADIAMYAAKSAGKNRIRIFTPEMQDGVALRHQVQTKLRQALSVGEIVLYFQPKVCAQSRKPIGCEALARWYTQDGKAIPPSDFIPIAEQTGLILPLGELVFQLAAQQACEWFSAGHLPAIAVNISPHQIRHPRFTERLQSVLDETGARAEWFELEITEHAMMDDVDHAVTVIDELASLGFRVAIDDFGTGYSSLSYLKNFRFDTLKIDVSFVRDVTHDTPSNAVIRSIVSLGSGLGITVVAEGVETAQQAAVLSQMGCTVLQGYHIGKPMDGDAYVRWLKQPS